MSQPLGVSIIIPNYNYAGYVGAAIDSALAQTHQSVEVIVVDDGSTDGSRAVIAGYGDRITAIFQANAGQTRACSEGFRHSRFPIVIFLDSDDCLVPEAAAMAAAHWPPGTSKRQFRLQTSNSAGQAISHVWPKYPRQQETPAILGELMRTGYYQCPPTSGNAFDRTFLQQVWPFQAHPHVDAVLNTLAPLYGEVLTSHEIIAYYRMHGANNYSTDQVKVSCFANMMAADSRRIAILGEHCRALGIPFDDEAALRQLLPCRELEVVVAKLQAADLKDYAAVLGLMAATLKAGHRYPQAWWHRLMRGVWIAGVAVLPKPLSVKLIGLRYVPTSRPALLERVANAFQSARAST